MNNAQTSALSHFCTVWSDDLMDDVAKTLNCEEVQALADLLSAQGYADSAQLWVENHTATDEECDEAIHLSIVEITPSSYTIESEDGVILAAVQHIDISVPATDTPLNRKIAKLCENGTISFLKLRQITSEKSSLTVMESVLTAELLISELKPNTYEGVAEILLAYGDPMNPNPTQPFLAGGKNGGLFIALARAGWEWKTAESCTYISEAHHPETGHTIEFFEGAIYARNSIKN